jgi:hypothetical protein
MSSQHQPPATPPATDAPSADQPETVVPDDADAERCPHCGRPFATRHLLALHVGNVHPDDATDDERAAYEAAYDQETDELFVYHLKIVAAIVVLFFGFAYAYVFVWAG